jgi:hypothetical protein
MFRNSFTVRILACMTWWSIEGWCQLKKFFNLKAESCSYDKYEGIPTSSSPLPCNGAELIEMNLPRNRAWAWYEWYSPKLAKVIVINLPN